MKTRFMSAVLVLALGFSGAQARGGDDRHHNRHSHHSHHASSAQWIVPLVIGGVVGYTLSRPQTISVATYTPAPRYAEEWVYFGDCDCKRRVLVEVR